LNDPESPKQVFPLRYIRQSGRVILIVVAIGFFMLFLPWTQNVYMEGNITTLEPETRPQEIQSVIEGKIDRWYVKEGMFVQKGDTIARISEIKDQYWDPFLLTRTQEQMDAKKKAQD